MIPEALSDLVGPPCPPIAFHAWGVFLQLHSTRGSSASGVAPITYHEIGAFQQVTDTPLTPFDVTLVRTADDAFLAFALDTMRTDTREP